VPEAPVLMGKDAELVVHQGEQLVERASVALLNGLQQLEETVLGRSLAHAMAPLP
jgi:hypothetical protein